MRKSFLATTATTMREAMNNGKRLPMRWRGAGGFLFCGFCEYVSGRVVVFEMMEGRTMLVFFLFSDLRIRASEI